MRQQIIDQKARELKQYVGLAMSLDECEDFVSGVAERLVTDEVSSGVSDQRELLISFMNFRDQEVYWDENEYTENEEIIDLWLLKESYSR